MKIMFNILEEPIKIESFTSVVIESKKVFAHIVQDIYNFESGEPADIRIFTEDQKNISPAEMMVITDIINYEINSATTLKLIYKDLEDNISLNPERKTYIEGLLGQIWSEINKETVHFEVNLELENITLQGIFKALGVKIETYNISIFEKIMDILQVFKYLPKKKLLVLTNLGTYLVPEEIKAVEEYVALQNIHLLLLDNAVFETAKQIVIDEDFVVMRRKNF